MIISNIGTQLNVTALHKNKSGEQQYKLTNQMLDADKPMRFSGKNGSRQSGLLQKSIASLVTMLTFMPFSQATNTKEAIQLAESWEIPALTLSDRQQYEEMEQQWQHVESLPMESAGRAEKTEKLVQAWYDLREKAVNGDKGALKVVHALQINRMYDEITKGDLSNLIRPDYLMFEILSDWVQNGQYTKSQFKDGMTWRAMMGVSSYFDEFGFKNNELIQNIDRFYEPTMHLLLTNNHEKIQKWAHFLMTDIFGTLSDKQQTRYLEQVLPNYLTSKDSADKYKNMRAIVRLYRQSPNLPIWKPFLEKVMSQTAEKPLTEEHKYHVALLALIKNPDLMALIPGELAQPDAPLQVQRGAAWYLGRVKSDDGFATLVRMLRQPGFDNLSREMAVYSIAEYNNEFPNQVSVLLKRLASPKPDENVPENVIEAARAMQQKMTDMAGINKVDYYINQYLSSDEEKTGFKAMRDKYIKGLDILTIEQRNLVDRGLLAYHKHLPEIIKKGGYHEIVETITDAESYKEALGARAEDGRLYETLTGQSGIGMGSVSKAELLKLGFDNVVTHEYIHDWHRYILNQGEKPNQEVEALFEAATKGNYLPNSYGGNNSAEFLAEWGEAMEARYKDHTVLWDDMFENSFNAPGDDTRSDLKRKDPDTYEFLKSRRSIPLEE